MKILWLSWRDIKNPQAGGAEKVAIAIASRLVKDKHQVTIFTSEFPKSKTTERIKDINIIRRGNRLTCRLFALTHYLKNRNFDIVIDEINTIPFFTPIYAGGKTVALIHQLARRYWFTQTIWPINLLGFWLEPRFLKLYRTVPTLVISKSTSKDLKKLNFRNIKIVRLGLSFKPVYPRKKEDLILFIGRLTIPKGPKDAIIAFKKICDKKPQMRLKIVGRGQPRFVRSLKNLSTNLNLSKKIYFAGYVPDTVKVDLFKRAKIILIPSIREGWNLVATEASAAGCVPIAYDVPGLRDSVKNNQTGILTDANPKNLAQAAIKVLENEKLRKTLAQNGYNWSQQFSWDNTYSDFKKALVGKLSKAPR